MSTQPTPGKTTDSLVLTKGIFMHLIPAIWRQVFVAPMAMRGEYDTCGLRSKLYPAMRIQIWKDQIEVTHQNETYKIGWATARPLHVTGDWTFSSNWASAPNGLVAELINVLVKHSINTADQIGRF